MAEILSRTRLLSGFDGQRCKVDLKMMSDGETAVMTYCMLLLSGSDVFSDTCSMISHDGGRTFGKPKLYSRMEKTVDGVRTVCSVTATFYHRHSGRWIVLGKETSYVNAREPICRAGIAIGAAVMSFYDPKIGDVTGPFTPIPLPIEAVSACPHGQVIQYENGDFLMSYYLTTEDNPRAVSMTVRYALEGNTLRIVRAGTPVSVGDGYNRGVYEPSVTQAGDRYFMCLRSDEVGLYATSEDGYTFTAPQPLHWEDGTVLENYNTMHRWLRPNGEVYLAYTRKNGMNDHVFRHRAPLYMTRFDTERCCLIREEERILVPELGARLGNFSVTEMEEETIVTVAEWMQHRGCEKYGSDNSLWVVRVGEKK